MSASLVLWGMLTYARLATANNCDNNSDDDDDDRENFTTITFVSGTHTFTRTVPQNPSNTCFPRPGQRQDDSGSGLSKGAIAGVVVAIIIVLLSVCFLLLCLRRRRARRIVRKPDLAAAPSTAHPMHAANVQLSSLDAARTNYTPLGLAVAGHPHSASPQHQMANVAPSVMAASHGSERPQSLLPAFQMANIAPSPVTADQILSGAKAAGTAPAGSLVDPAAAMKALPATPSESHVSCSSSTQPSSLYASSSALLQPHTQPPSGPSRASSELHSEMWLHQKDLQLQHRQQELEAADPPPSYEAVADPQL